MLFEKSILVPFHDDGQSKVHRTKGTMYFVRYHNIIQKEQKSVTLLISQFIIFYPVLDFEAPFFIFAFSDI